MIAFPLYILLFVYLIFLAIFFVFVTINFYYIITSGAFTSASFMVSFFVFALTVLTIYLTFALLIHVNWRKQVQLYNPAWFQNNTYSKGI